MIKLIPYENKYQPEFKRLNTEWLEKYGLMEKQDLETLDDPQGKVIQGGGCIFLAMDGEKVIGTAGLVKESDEEFELVKMAVDQAYRGQGISKILLDKCLHEARDRKAKKLILFSNSQLHTALKLYSNYGFRHVEVSGTSLLTADVKMELIL